jgi:hypothetical protein
MKNLKRLILLLCVLVFFPLHAFAAATLFTAGKFHARNADGTAMAGGLLYSYLAGTTTPQNTYTDQSGGTANTNPVVLDANGEADVWLTGIYKFVLKDANGNLQWSEDNISDSLFSNAFSGTSATSSAVTTGTITFTTQAGKAWSPGQDLKLSSNANSANFMLGAVSSYTGTTLVMNIVSDGGSGTYADWNISLSGGIGPTGPAGPTGSGAGDVIGPATSTDGYFAIFNGTNNKTIKASTGGPGTAAFLNVGTSANQVVQLTAASKYPAADGSLITHITAANIDGTISGIPVVTKSATGKIVMGTVTLQWGSGSVTNTTCTTNSFGTAFSATAYSVTATCSDGTAATLGISSITATTFCAKSGQNLGPCSIKWMAIGPT